MGLRDDRQIEFGNIYLESLSGGILNLCPRFGKCRVGIHIFKNIDPTHKILITYPENQIKDSWRTECELMGYDDSNIDYVNHRSLHKVQDEYDLIVIDEIHNLSPKQLFCIKDLKKARLLGLTGTMAESTKTSLRLTLGLHVLAEYPIETAIKEGVLTDYEIHVKVVPLNTTQPVKFRWKYRTEKTHFDVLSNKIEQTIINNNKDPENRKPIKMDLLARVSLIKNSVAKIKATNDLLKQYKNERVLVFCGEIAPTNHLSCPVYHSKSKKEDKEEFQKFADGESPHYAVIKIGNMGKTYKPLDKVIINYFSSDPEDLTQKINRCMAIEYNNPQKKAIIWLISTDEPVELNWLRKSLEFFDPVKIKYHVS